MTKIKLLKPTMDRGIGTVLVVNDDHARLLIEKGNAEKFVEVTTKAVVSADTKAIRSREKVAAGGGD